MIKTRGPHWSSYWLRTPVFEPSNHEQRCKKQKVKKCKFKYPQGQRGGSAIQSLSTQTWWPQSHPLIPCEKLDVAVHIWFPCTPTRGMVAWARNFTRNSWGPLACRSPTHRQRWERPRHNKAGIRFNVWKSFSVLLLVTVVTHVPTISRTINNKGF